MVFFVAGGVYCPFVILQGKSLPSPAKGPLSSKPFAVYGAGIIIVMWALAADASARAAANMEE